SAGRRLPALFVCAADCARWLVFKKGDLRVNANFPGSARALACWLRRPRRSHLCSSRSRKVRERGGGFASTRGACALQILAITLYLMLNAGAATLQEKIDAAAPNETIRVESGVHAGAIVIKKSVTLVGEPGAEIRGNGSGKVVTIAAND